MTHQVGDKVLVEATVAAIDDNSDVIKILTPMPDGQEPHWAYVDASKAKSREEIDTLLTQIKAIAEEQAGSVQDMTLKGLRLALRVDELETENAKLKATMRELLEAAVENSGS